MPWAAPLAAVVRAGVDALRGAREEADQALGLAASGFDSLDMALYAAAARLQRAHLGGGGAGEARARAWMEGQGIVHPARMAEMLVPGVR
jgi:hypothetical protein